MTLRRWNPSGSGVRASVRTYGLRDRASVVAASASLGAEKVSGCTRQLDRDLIAPPVPLSAVEGAAEIRDKEQGP